MGGRATKEFTKQVLLVGLNESGKTKFMYETYAFASTKGDANTKGFNYEVLDTEGGKLGIWDVGGSSFMRCYWPCFYQNIHFDGVIFMIDLSKAKSMESFETSTQDLMWQAPNARFSSSMKRS